MMIGTENHWVMGTLTNKCNFHYTLKFPNIQKHESIIKPSVSVFFLMAISVHGPVHF